MKPESTDALSALRSAQLVPGVFTNDMPDPVFDEAELAAGRLDVEPIEGGLLLFFERDGFRRMRFYLGGSPAIPKMTAPTVTEIPCRAGDPKAADAIRWLTDAGFAPVLNRRRLTRDGFPPPGNADRFRATEEDLSDAAAVLSACFDPMTGCLPTEDALAAAIRRREILLARDADTGAAVGVLHWRPVRGGTELRHLAVLPAYRLRGIGGALTLAFLSGCAGTRSRVWVREDNRPANTLYDRLGYVPDGMRSTVLKAMP